MIANDPITVPRGSREPLVVRYVRTPAGLEGLGREWEPLHAQAAAASVFNSWNWQSTWWRLQGRDRQLLVLVATRGGSLVGVLPLYIEAARHLGLPVRILRLLGDGGGTVADGLGPLLAPGEEADAAPALAAAVFRVKAFDVARLSNIDPCSTFPAALLAEAEALQLKCSLERAERSATDRRETLSVSAFRPTVGAAAFRADQLYLRRTKASVRSLAKSLLPSRSVQRQC